MRTLLTRALAGVLLTVAAATTAGAQSSPTPENTVITNTATASFTDANGNTYSNVSANVAVTVGFQASVDAQSPASQTPVAGSSGNNVAITLVNDGNGIDRFNLVVTPPSGVTVTGFVLGGTPYASAAALNAVLNVQDVAAAGNVVVTVQYSVAAANSGTGNLVFTVNSVRQNTVTDAATTQLNYTAQAIVGVTAAQATSNRLPSANAAQTYTQDFTVANTGSASGTFALSVSTNANITNAALGAPSVTVAAGASATITVTYNVLSSAAAGASGTIQVTATEGAVTGSGTHTVTVIRPLLAITKQVFRADGTTAIAAADRVLPNEVITYRITVTNNGTAAASTVSVSDPVPAQATYVASSVAGTGWTTLVESSGTITGTLATLAVGDSRNFTFQVRVR